MMDADGVPIRPVDILEKTKSSEIHTGRPGGTVGTSKGRIH